jgi:hypothetical protein
MPKVRLTKARADIYTTGLRVPDEKTKSGFRVDRSKPADSKDKVWCPKGETYYTWGMMMGGRGVQQRSRTQPKRSQLTNSDFLGQIYDLEDDSGFDAATCPEDLASARDDIAQQLRDLGQEQQDKYDNMPDGLQQGDTGVLLEERAQACEQIADEFDQVDLDDYEDLDSSEIDEAKDEFRSEKEMADDAKVDEKDPRYIEIIEQKNQEKLDEWLEEKKGELENVSWDYS